MSSVTFTTEFTVARCLAAASSRMTSDVVYTSSGSRGGSVSWGRRHSRSKTSR
jgi:hypothetical protein